MKAVMGMLLLSTIAASSMVGQRAVEFSRQDVNGKTVSLEAYRGNKNVLLVFSRYIGCSYCQMFIVDLLGKADKIAQADTEVIVVVNSDAETARRFEPPPDFPFILVPDPRMDLYKEYGVKMKVRGLSWNVMKKSAKFMSYLPDYKWVKGGLAGDHLQAPACFVIDKEGVIRYEHLGRDIADNADVEEILRVLSSLN